MNYKRHMVELHTRIVKSPESWISPLRIDLTFSVLLLLQSIALHRIGFTTFLCLF